MVEFNRIFSMSAFEGARQIRLRRKDHPTSTRAEIIEIIREVDADGQSHDFEAAIVLDDLLAMTCSTEDPYAFYRDCIEINIRQHRPVWAKTILLGRKFIQKLHPDEQQCFQAAGLMEDPPSDATVSWWDKTSSTARMISNSFGVDQSRIAEKMTMEYEIKRMTKLGIAATPKWMAVEDNTLGYDILSYDVGTKEPVARVLEVKSTVTSPRFYVSRNEWEVCKKMGPAYLFHIWDMKTGNLFERTLADVMPHIPQDQGTGKWSSVEIKIGA